MKREAQQSALPAAAHEGREVEERRPADAPVREHHDLAALQRQEEARVSGMGDRRGLREARGQRFEGDLGSVLRAKKVRRRDRREREDESDGESADPVQVGLRTGNRRAPPAIPAGDRAQLARIAYPRTGKLPIP